MYRNKTQIFNGVYVNIIEAKEDLTHSVHLSVMAEKFDVGHKKLAIEFRDKELESQGYERIAVVNGGLFFTEGSSTFAEGIEKAFGVVNELDDSNLDSCLTLATLNGNPYVATQSYIKANQSRFRGFVTGAFGLINNGLVDTRGKAQRSYQYNAKSGRTIVGKKPDGTIVLASFYGETGKGGLTGYQTVLLAKNLGLNNAVCMDGGGSVSMVYQDVWKVKTSRLIKNAVGLYARKKG